MSTKPQPSARETAAIRYRRRQVLGLLMLAAIILGWTLARADPKALFPQGWWRW